MLGVQKGRCNLPILHIPRQFKHLSHLQPICREEITLTTQPACSYNRLALKWQTFSGKRGSRYAKPSSPRSDISTSYLHISIYKQLDSNLTGQAPQCPISRTKNENEELFSLHLLFEGFLISTRQYGQTIEDSWEQVVARRPATRQLQSFIDSNQFLKLSFFCRPVWARGVP